MQRVLVCQTILSVSSKQIIKIFLRLSSYPTFKNNNFLLLILNMSIYILECIFYPLKVLSIIICFSIFRKLCPNIFDIWFNFFTNKRKINNRRKSPSDQCNNDSRSDQCSETTSHSCNKVRPKHLPGRMNIFHKFFKS